uniref:NADH dehydrogenase subunit 5 n=1 Tax=Thoradonta yunnana TaxID=515186 RepID=UPI0023AAB998|nr:NADH dehydrogenase subunit 5 [Thoradonta yunnana]WCF77157.1 NADH dehydrogenase subunit 5 [Thoradonta yunnana]WCK12007.1 NADH dehydrogenase subunit 5 [Thoradonta yunnana]
MMSIFYTVSMTFMMFSLFFFILSLYLLLFDLSYMLEWEVYSLNSSSIVMGLIFDWMSVIFMSLVLFISSMVLFYSNMYMGEDPFKIRFVMLVGLFVLSMIFLIVSPNMISILLGWDGLGLVSYCLVIYYQNVKSFNAGMLTALSNRVGDVLILISISWMLNFGSWNYVYYYDYFFSSFDYSIICYLIMGAAMTKSAQLPFSAWLPAAMAAPTPVSALVHSSTLVTAGVYLMIRFNPMIVNSGASFFMLFIGCLTMLMAGLVANFEFDLKKVIALSTLSQLGLMMSILAMGFPVLSFFHLLTHALFKSLLFLCAGCYIHGLLDQQDIRFMGSFTMSMPYSSICFHVSNLGLCGFPFLSGFYSKDLILEMCSMSVMNFLIYLMFFVSTGLTIMYSVRLFYYSLVSDFNFSVLRDFNNCGGDMYKGMIYLLILVILGGSLLSWLLFPVPSCVYLPLSLKLLTMVVMMGGLYLGYLLSIMNFLVLNLNSLVFFLGSMWYIPVISSKVFSYPTLFSGYLYLKLLDYGWLELYGSQGIYDFMKYYIFHYLYLFDYNFKTYTIMFMSMVLIILIGMFIL